MLKPISEIKLDLGLEPNGKVQKFFTNTCYNHMDKYVPRETGALRDNVDLQADSITYQSPYAHYMYIGHQYVMANGKSAYYTPEYGYWSKPRSKKNRQWKAFALSYSRNWTILG